MVMFLLNEDKVTLMHRSGDLRQSGEMEHLVKTNLIEQPLQLLQNQNSLNTIKLKFEKNSIETFTTEIKK